MTILDHAIRFLEAHPVLTAVPVPRFIGNTLDAHYRRRKLVVEIASLSDLDTACAALWLARAVAVTHPFDSGVTVERVLEAIRDLHLAGAIGRS